MLKRLRQEESAAAAATEEEEKEKELQDYRRSYRVNDPPPLHLRKRMSQRETGSGSSDSF